MLRRRALALRASRGSIPIAPSGLTATPSTTTTRTIDLAWLDNSSDETSFAIYRGTDGISYSELTTTLPGVTSYSDSGLTDGQIYYYKVLARNSTGDSAFTSAASATAALLAIPVTWDQLTGMSLTVTTLRKTAGDAWGNGAARTSIAGYTGDVRFDFVCAALSTGFVCGLTDDPSGSSYVDVGYGINNGSNAFQVYQAGTGPMINTGAIAVNDILSVRRSGNTITYYKNGTLMYTSLVSAAGKTLKPMCAAFTGSADQIKDAIIYI